MLYTLRIAVRSLLKARAFTLVAVSTLALGIGANTAIFSVVHALLLRPPAYPEPDRIMVLTETRLPQFPTYPVSGANFLDWQRHLKSFETLGGARNTIVDYSDGVRPRRLDGQRATRGYFEVFATAPSLGRVFSAEEDAGGTKVTVISHALWQALFAGEAAAVGRSLLLDGTPHRVIGVMPAHFQKAGRVQLWLPMAFTTQERSDEYRGAHFLDVVGRLRPGVTPEQALEELGALAHDLQRRYPDSNKSCGAHLLPLAERDTRDVAQVLYVLLGSVACVLLIACLNVANLQLARGAARAQELAVRSALGASRSRLMGQLLAESLLLSLVGGALGVVVAGGLVATIVRLIPASLAQVHRIALDAPVLVFTLGLSLLCGLVFGLLPAWRVTRLDLTRATRDAARGNSGARSRLQAALVAFEVTAAVVLLAGAALLGRSFARLHEADKGFRSEQALMLELTLPRHRYATPEARRAFVRDLLPRLAALRGVSAAGATHRMPLVRDAVLRLIVEGRPPVAAGDLPNTNYYAITADYLRAMAIPVLRGRSFDERDDENAPRVALINETFARKFFPGENPLGRRIRITNGDDAWREVVGVVRDVKSRGALHEVIPQSYEPYEQQPDASLWVVLRFLGDPAPLTAAIQQAVAAVDRDQPIGQLRLVDEIVADTYARPRLATTLVGGFSLVALLLAAVGIYGMVSYRVVQQTREMGIRLALGATPGTVLGRVLSEGLAMIGVGLVAGTAASLGLGQALQSLLFETSPRDPATLAGVSLVLLVVGALASWVPARRATKVDPMIVLRAD